MGSNPKSTFKWPKTHLGGCGKSSWTFWAQARVYPTASIVLASMYLMLIFWGRQIDSKLKFCYPNWFMGLQKVLEFSKNLEKNVSIVTIFLELIYKRIATIVTLIFDFLKKWIENDFFRKSLLACPKIVVSTCKTPRLNLLEYALLLRCFPAR